MSSYSPSIASAGVQTLAAADPTVTVGGTAAARTVRVAKQLDSSYVTDLAAFVAAHAGGAPSASILRTAGDYVINNVAWTTLDAGLDLSVPAVAGDVIEASLNAYAVPPAGGQYCSLDAVTIVANAVAHSFSNGAAVPANNGVDPWMIRGSTTDDILTGSRLLTLVAGDIENGAVKVRLRFKTGNAVAHTIRANAGDPLQFFVINHRQ